MNSHTNTIRSSTGLGFQQGTGGGLLARARQGLESLRRHQQRRQAIRELSRMSDWRLRDMGIERGHIAEVVDGLMARQGSTPRGTTG
jgi:uncharacterized protein YjiS (DUF1127 family)